MPIRHKLACLVALAAVAGVMVAVLEHATGHRVLPLLGGFLAAVVLITRFGEAWVCRPVDHMIDDLNRIARTRRPAPDDSELLRRQDEIGSLARLTNELAVHAWRGEAQVSQLRRTLDHRIAEATRRATKHLRQAAMRDPLTQLANRRFLDEHLDPLFATCSASATDLVCLAIDLDHFKAVNDTLGHAAGDRLLQFLARLLRAGVRERDYVVRVGGDEFLILMPGCDVDKAQRIAQRLARLFAQHVHASLPPELRIAAISIGISSLHRNRPATAAELLAQADHALYAVKSAGAARLS